MRNEGLEVDATRIKYPTSKSALEIAGLIPVDSEKKPPFIWIDGVLTKDEALEYEPYQIINKIPGMDYMCYKCTLFTALNEMRKFFPYQYNIYPKTYMLPSDFLEFQRDHMSICGKTGIAPTWIAKPKSGCCGNGITIIQSTHEAQKITYQAVIQQYVKPFLIENRKFDFRFYLLIGSLEPLNLYIYPEGIARFCSEDFQMPTRANKEDKFIHLTNTAVNVENGSVDASVFTKRASEILDKIDAQYHNREQLWSRICEVSRAVIIGILPKLLSLVPKKMLPSRLLPREFHAHKRAERALEDETQTEEDKVSQKCDVIEKVTQVEEKEQLGPIPEANEERKDHATPEKTRAPSPIRIIQADVIRKQTNMLILPRRKDAEREPLVVGSIVNYKINPISSAGPLVIQRRYDFSGRARGSMLPKKIPAYSFTLAKHNKAQRMPSISPPKARLAPLASASPPPLLQHQEQQAASVASPQTVSTPQLPYPVDILTKTEDSPQKLNDFVHIKPEDEVKSRTEAIILGKESESEEELQEISNQKMTIKPDLTQNTKDQKKNKPKAVRTRRRFFHVLGIDIILDSNMEPQVLELNDRPSLSVTVPFEKELKEGLLSEAFEHVSPTGECFGESANSRWQRIFPAEGETGSNWSEIYEKATHAHPDGHIDGVPINVRERQADPIIREMEKRGKKKRDSRRHARK